MAKILKARLPMEAVHALRHKGGSQSTKKGKKGYNRKTEKTRFKQIIKRNYLLFLCFFFLDKRLDV